MTFSLIKEVSRLDHFPPYNLDQGCNLSAFDGLGSEVTLNNDSGLCALSAEVD
jgi:hypothetical protein